MYPVLCLLDDDHSQLYHNSEAPSLKLVEVSLYFYQPQHCGQVDISGSQIRLQTGKYESPQELDYEMHESFLKARRFHKPGSGPYGNALFLQVSRIASSIPADRPNAILPSHYLLEPPEVLESDPDWQKRRKRVVRA